MSSSSQAVKDRFQAQFNPPPARNSEGVEENVHDADPLVTRKRRRAITDSERKSIRDYYFDPLNGKLQHKHVQQWFLEQYRHFLSQSTISECLSSTYAYLNTGSSRPGMKKQRHAQWTD